MCIITGILVLAFPITLLGAGFGEVYTESKERKVRVVCVCALCAQCAVCFVCCMLCVGDITKQVSHVFLIFFFFFGGKQQIRRKITQIHRVASRVLSKKNKMGILQVGVDFEFFKSQT